MERVYWKLDHKKINKISYSQNNDNHDFGTTTT